MGLFKKKTDYSYYSSYSSSRRRLKVGRTVIAVIAAVVVILGIIIYFNFNRIQFLMKGYSWSTTSELVKSFDNDEEKELLSHDEMKHILKWIDNSNKVALYDEYEQFYSLHKEMNYEDIVDVVNYIFENQAPSLKSMGYSEKTIWSMLKDGAGKSDLQFLIDNKLTNSQTAPFRKVKGYDLKKINDYIAQYNTVKDYNYAVNIVNYPFIVSSNGQTNAKYNIANPDDYLTLVKKGFYLNDYEPKDLVELDSEYVAPTCDHPQLRKVAAEALVKMIKDAKKYVDMINLALEAKPDDMVITMHICRGNFRSTWFTSGGYEPVAKTLFGNCHVDGFFLEYDSERAGGFEPLRYIQNQKVVLGLVTSKDAKLENKDEIIKRIHEAEKYVPLNQLALSPQCGFASTEEGNLLTKEEQWNKVKLVKEIAEEVW